MKFFFAEEIGRFERVYAENIYLTSYANNRLDFLLMNLCRVDRKICFGIAKAMTQVLPMITIKNIIFYTN